MAEDDLYAVFGVRKDADLEQIKLAWRDIARRLHPDRNPGDAAAAAAFSRASAAWTVLSDPDKRLVYDRLGLQAIREDTVAEMAAALRSARPSRPASPPPRAEPSRGVGPAPIPREPRAAKRPPVRAADIRKRLVLSLREAAAGGPRIIEIDDDEPCSGCEGTGLRGTGRFCPACAGAGHRVQHREVRVDVPISVASGQSLRIAGQGRADVTGRRGNLVVDVVVAVDPVFQRIGTALRVDAPFVPGAATVQVPTLDGPVTVEVPPTAKRGTSIRVAGKGMPAPGGRPPGDLLVTLR